MKETVTNLPNEVWKKTQYIGRYDAPIYVSNLGRVKLKYGDNETLYEPKTSKNKTNMYYHDVRVQNQDRNYYRLSRIIYQTFVDSDFDPSYKKDRRVIDHINGDTTDDRVSNLRICKNNGENIKLAILNGKTVGKAKKKCYAYNVETKEFREYDSTKELVRDIWNSDNCGYFYRYSKDKLVNGEGWSCGYDKEDLKTRKKTLTIRAREGLKYSNYNPFSIPVYCKENGKVYQSANEASRDTGIGVASILKQVKGETKHNNTGYTFVKWEK